MLSGFKATPRWLAVMCDWRIADRRVGRCASQPNGSNGGGLDRSDSGSRSLATFIKFVEARLREYKLQW
jgi:hypothetical protein